MDPNNGDLLALVSKPSFDSNKFISGFSKDEISQLNDTQLNRWVNRATGSGNIAYPPGSIFKIISSIAYLELRQNLVQQGVQFNTFSDTEVLLQMLIRYGANALGELNGMFAFVFHDRKDNKWLAARDPFGIKPLYFAEVEEQFLFASEIKSLLAQIRQQMSGNYQLVNKAS